MLSLTTFVSGCFGLTETVYVPAGTTVPALDPRDEAVCPDPGVVGTALSALADNRLALADCRRRHANVVGQYNSVREAAMKEQ